MAVSSLGRLTLDLAVKLSNFTDGMSKAERETKAKTDKMNKSVNDFKSNLLDGLDGTSVGNAFRNLNNNFKGVGSAAGAAGLAIGAVGAAALGAAAGVGVLIKEQTQLAKEITRYANIANASTDAMQKTAIAAKSVGFEMDKLADVYKDVQDKVGDFITTGGGEMKDFFEFIAPQVGVTAEQFRKLSGPDALQLYYDSLQKANIGQSEMVFYMEAVANDATALIPLLKDGGEGFNLWADAAEKAGAIMDEETIRATQELTTSTDLMKLALAGAKNTIVREVLPVVSDMAAAFVTDANAKELAKAAGEMLAGGLRILAKVAVTTATVFQGLSIIVGTTAETFGALFRGISLGDSAMMTALKMAINYQKASSIFKAGDQEFQAVNARMADMMSKIDTFGRGGVTNPMVHQLTDITTATGNLNGELGLTGQQIEAAGEAADKSAKKTAKAVKELSRMEQVYAAFVKAGMSDNQARIMTAEVGREGSFLDKNLFGYHKDPHNGAINAGMISWQGDRGKELIKYLTSLGLVKNGKIMTTQEALDAQAMFVVKEITSNSKYSKTKNDFLANPDVSYQQGNETLGKNYIRWRYDDSRYKSGHKNRDNYYQQLNAKLGDKGLANNLARQAQEEQRAAEKLLQQQQAIAIRYMNEREKYEAEHRRRIAEINEIYGEDSKEAAQYRAIEEERYKQAVNDRALSVMRNYQDKEERLTQEHEEALQEIREKIAKDDPRYQLALDAQEAYFQKEMQRIRYQDGEKYRQAQKHIGDIRNLIEWGTQSAQDRTMDVLNRGSMHPDDYARWGLNREYQSAVSGADSNLANRQNDINQRDEFGEFLIQNEERNKLLQEAKRAHEAEMYAIELEYAEKSKELEKEIVKNKIQSYGSAISSTLGMLQGFLGESKNLQRLAWAATKGFHLASILIAEQDALTKAWASAPFPYNLGAVAVVAAEVGAIQAAASAITPKGFKTGGYTGNLGVNTVAGVVHGNEYVFDAQATKAIGVDNLERIRKGKGTGELNVQVNNYSNATVDTQKDSDGNLVLTIRDEVKRSWSNLQNPNSHESKMLGRNVQAPRRR